MKAQEEKSVEDTKIIKYYSAMDDGIYLKKLAKFL